MASGVGSGAGVGVGVGGTGVGVAVGVGVGVGRGVAVGVGVGSLQAAANAASMRRMSVTAAALRKPVRREADKFVSMRNTLAVSISVAGSIDSAPLFNCRWVRSIHST